jgi:hypothetical protein
MNKIRILQPLVETHDTFSTITYEYLYDNKKYSFTNKFLSKIDNLYTGIEGLISIFIPHCILTGSRIETDIPVDKKYLDNVQNLVGVFKRLHNNDKLNLNIHATNTTRSTKTLHNKNIAAFTLGVDSFYTLYSNINNLDSILFIIGFDVKKHQETLLEMTIKSLKEISKIYGKELILCETELKNKIDHGKGFDWAYYFHGAAIFNIAYGLSNIFDDLIIPSTFESKDEFKWGSHFMLDEHYSSSMFNIKHNGDIRRTEKVKFITNYDIKCLEHLRVCYVNKNQDYNCTECKKCLRTLYMLELLGYKNKAATFKQNANGIDFFKLKVSNEMEQGVVDDIKRLELELGIDRNA